MNKRMIAPALFGLVGAVILVLLGNWQIDRMIWKNAILAEIDARLIADPVPLPEDPTEARDLYLSVRVEGEMLGEEIHVLASSPATGPGYRVLTAFQTSDGRRILVDRGVVPEAEKDSPRQPENGVIYGNLYWLQDDIAITPPNFRRNIWFGRDPVALSEALDTEPVMLVMNRTSQTGGPHPAAVGNNIPNSHLGYALTWYGLALVWIGMTLYLLVRIKRKTV